VNSGSSGIGHVTSQTSPLNEVYSYSYDLDRRLKTAQDPSGAAVGKSTSYGYDADGQVTSVTDENGNITTYSYPVNITAVETVCYPWNTSGSCWTYKFDANGRCRASATREG
jgi:YD repeat-containing protein